MNFSSINLAMVLCLSGFAITTLEGYAGLRSHEAQQWEEVTGRITECRTETSHLRTISSKKRRARYEKKIKYEYNYDGQSLEGSRVGFDDMVSTVRFTGIDLTGRTAGLKSGESIPVFVNPDDPTDAVLHRSFGAVNATLLGIGIVVMFFGMLGLLAKFR